MLLLLLLVIVAALLGLNKLNWSFASSFFQVKVSGNRHIALYRIGYIYWLENFIQYRLSEYWQNVISVQHYCFTACDLLN